MSDDRDNGLSLRVSIIGAGMGGLATALALAKSGCSRHITVYETASDLGFVGAGIQVAPNLSRILSNLGVLHGICTNAVQLDEASIRSLYSIMFLPCVCLLTLLYVCRINHRRRTCPCPAHPYRGQLWFPSSGKFRV
jgi:hypothetical protein